jgi:hypothetical protein
MDLVANVGPGTLFEVVQLPSGCAIRVLEEGASVSFVLTESPMRFRSSRI